MNAKQLQDAYELEQFDRACTYPDTAVKAIWLLYRRGMWANLAKIGLPRAQFVTKFETFDDQFLSGDVGRVRTERDVHNLIQFIPEVLTAAIRLSGVYTVLNSTSILVGEHQ
jgi:hypothetical protein